MGRSIKLAIISFLALAASSVQVASASQETKVVEQTKQNAVPPPFKIAGKTSRAVQKYSGLTFLAEKGIDLSGDLAARCILGGHPKFKVKAYSLTDCLAGKFQSVSLDLKDCSYKKTPLADLNFRTSTPLQFRLFKAGAAKPAGIAVPVMVAVKGEIAESDLSAALQSPKISSQLNFLRLDLPGLGDQHLQIVEPKVKLADGKIKINSWLVTAGASKDTGITVDIVARPELEKERFIMLRDTKINSPDIVDPEQFSKFSQNLLNPLLDFARFDRKTHAFRLTQFNLVEQKMQFAGKLLLVPKPVPAENAPTALSSK